MSKEYELNFNLNNYISVEEPYKDDYGCALFGVIDDDSGLLNLLYETNNDKQINFFIDLVKYVTDLEAKLAEKEKELEQAKNGLRYQAIKGER